MIPGTVQPDETIFEKPDFLFGPLDETPMPNQSPLDTPGTSTQQLLRSLPGTMPEIQVEQTYVLPKAQFSTTSPNNSVTLPASTVIQTPVANQYPLDQVELPGRSPFSPAGLNSVISPTVSDPPWPLNSVKPALDAQQIWDLP